MQRKWTTASPTFYKPVTTGSTKHLYRLKLLYLSDWTLRFQNGCYKVVTELHVVRFCSKIMLVISNLAFGFRPYCTPLSSIAIVNLDCNVRVSHYDRKSCVRLWNSFFQNLLHCSTACSPLLLWFALIYFVFLVYPTSSVLAVNQSLIGRFSRLLSDQIL